MTLLFGGLLLSTSCKLKQEMENEMTNMRVEIAETQALNSEMSNEINKVLAESNSLKTHQSLKKGTGAFEQEVHNLEKEIPALTEMKRALETEIAALKKELQDYKAKTGTN